VLGSVTFTFSSMNVANETSFKPATYTPTDSVQQQHHFYRFGHTNNLGALILGLSGSHDGSNDLATDYILGVTASSMLIFGIALLWFLVILGFKCAGHKRVGFLAGRLESPSWHPEYLFPIDECLTEDDEDVSTQTPTGHQHSASSGPENFSARGTELELGKQVKFKRKALAVRVMFIISGIFVMTAGALFYTEGVTAFLYSLNDVQNSLLIVESTALESMNLTRSALEAKRKLLSGLNETIIETGSGFCQGSGQIANEIRGEAQQLVSDIQEMSSAVDMYLKSLSTDLMTVANMAKGLNNDLQTASGFFYALIAISILIVVLICIMLAVTVFSAKDISNCFTKCVTSALIWPVFTFLLVLSWICATLFLVFSLAGSDFCYRPDQIITAVLTQNKDKFDSVIFAFIIYYVSGCVVVPQAMDDLTKLITMVKTMLATANELAAKVASQGVDDLATGCGLDKAGAAALQKGAQVICEVSQALETLLGNFKGIVSCQNINPIYTSLVYDATCTEAVSGFTWLYGTCFALCICAMIMITFRAALYPIKRSERDRTGLNAPLLSSKNVY